MAFPFSRASRVYRFVPDAGSSVEVKQYFANGTLDTGPSITLDIEQGTLVDIHKNQVTTNSGGVGETQRTRVGFDWNYQLILSFPGALVGSSLATAFIQRILGSSDYVWMRFYMGDPEYWTAQFPKLQIRSFLGTRSLMSQCEQRVNPLTQEVIGLRVAGEGSSLLRAELDAVAVYP